MPTSSPTGYIAAAKAAGYADGMGGYPDWSPAQHLELMEQGGIRASVLSVSSPGTHFGDDTAARALTQEMNEYAAGLRREHPGHFASLPLPDIEGALAEIA